MKSFGFGIILFIWMILTFILSVSLVGWFVLAPDVDNTDKKSTWMKMGTRLVELIKES